MYPAILNYFFMLLCR